MANQSGVFSIQEFSDLGALLVGGRLYTYVYGTTTQKTAYTDAAASVAHTYTSDGIGGQYIALNARGELPAPLYLTSGSYDLCLKTAAGATIWTRRTDSIGDNTFTSAGTGAVARTITDRLGDTVNVMDFIDASQHAYIKAFDVASQNVPLVTAGVQAALEYLETVAGTGGLGATLEFPNGALRVTGGGIVHNQLNMQLTLRGQMTELQVVDGGIIIDAQIPAGASQSFTMENFLLYGTGGASPSGTGVKIAYSIKGGLRNVHFFGLDTCLLLGDVIQNTFNFRCSNYNYGLKGIVGHNANNNHFEMCSFNDGVIATPATAKPIVAAYTGYNTYTACTFESSGYIATVDMSGGNGYDVFLNPRFERCNPGSSATTTDWLKVGNFQRYICPIFAPSEFAKRVVDATYLVNFPASTVGTVIEDMALDAAYGPNTVFLGASSTSNRVRFRAPAAADAYTAVYRVVRDLGISNTIEYSHSTMVAQTDSWGSAVTQRIGDSLNMATDWTPDGLTKTLFADVGPHGDGYVWDLNTPTGNKKIIYQDPTVALGILYTTTFSVWVKSKTTSENISLSLGSSGGAPTWKTFRITNQWERIWLQCRDITAGATIYAQMRVDDGASTGVLFYGPQFEEVNNNVCQFGPGGYIRTSSASTGAFVTDTPAKIGRGNRYGDKVTAIGTWRKGEDVKNLLAASGGTPGWVCTTSGTPGTWKARANLA